MDAVGSAGWDGGLEVVLEAATSRIAYLSHDLRFVYVNPAYAKGFGWRREDLIGRAHSERFPAPDLVVSLEHAITTGESIRISNRPHYDLRERRPATHWEWSITPILDGTGPPLGLVITLTDTSELMKAEEALRESEERYRLLVELSPEAIAVHLRGRLVFANQTVARLLGAGSADELIGRSVLDFVAKDQVDFIRDRIREVLEVGHAPAIPEKFRRLDGSIIDVEVTAIRIPYEGGPANQLFIRDITEQKRTADAIRFLADASAILASSLDYEITIERVAQLAIPRIADLCVLDIIDEDLPARIAVVCHVDPEKDRLAKRVWAERPIDLPRNPRYFDVFLKGDALLYERLPRSSFESPGLDEPHRSLLATLAPHSCAIVPLVGREKMLGIISFAITEAKRPRFIPEDLPFLEEVGRRAGVAIDNASLHRKLKEEDRRKDEFLAMLAHELRNPLSAIASAIKIQGLRGIEDPVVVQSQDTAERQVQHMSRLLDDLLEATRISSGKIELRLELVDLAAVVRHVVQALRSQIEGKRQHFTVIFPERSIRLRADPGRLEQILQNLLLNAIKYTPNGGHIRLLTATDGNDAVLRVLDNGIGISKEILPRIFEPFVQEGRSLDRAQGGLGLGLSLVKQLVEMHGGTVVAKSEGPGHGSEFVLRLPRRREFPDESDVWARSKTPVHALPGEVRRVLIVEDNEDVSVMLASLLRIHGHNVMVASDGPKALDLARKHQPEVVLLDIGLPGMDGFEVAKRLRSLEEAASALIVAVTGYGQEPDRRRAAEAGFNHHLVKPVDHDQLLRLITGSPQRSRKSVVTG
jgi:PAS domain S-box-containing protein